MNLVLFGPPGAGKGTQAQMLCSRFHLTHLSTGDALRAAIRNGSDLGKQVEDKLARGELISDDLVSGLVDDFIAERRNDSDSFLFDGFPRTLKQIEHLTAIIAKHRLTDPAVVSLEVPDDLLMLRISGRRQCGNCKRIFNIHFTDMAEIQQCQQCGGNPPVIHREDDKPETVQERLRVYRNQTEPVLQHYENTGQLATIDGTGEPDEVFDRIYSILSEHY